MNRLDQARLIRFSTPVPRLRPLCLAIRVLLASGALFAAEQASANPGMVLPKPEAAFATLGAATYAQDGVRGVINQQTDKAILNWKSFDIGPQNSVEFKQPTETSIALNRINERANPSQILGELKANGQVYLYNPNGFVFGKNSRVNVNSLVATTLNVSDEAFERGVTKVFDQNPSQSGVERASFIWTGRVYDTETLGADGKPTQVQVREKPEGTGIKIEAGAQISTNAPNRRILIVAPTVENRGSVKADDGEVIMVATTDKLYLQEAPGTASVSGLLVEVGTGGAVSNFGSVTAHRGNITLAGFAVNQNGMVSASTSVRQNGTIRLLAREGGRSIYNGKGVDLQASSTYRRTDSGDGLGQIARVTLGPNSVTQVLPDIDDPITAVDEQPQLKSKIEITGKQVRFESSSQVLAPSGIVSVSGLGQLEGQDDPAPRDTRIDMAAGSKISVSGLTNISVPMEKNVVDVELRLNELRDSPLQRNGLLRNQTVQVDVRRGTPLADITSAVQRVGRTIAERSTTGGSISLSALGAVVINPGAEIDIAGGSVNFQGGYVKTTQLISNRRLVDISQADPSLLYEGVFTGLVTKTYAKWNQTRTWQIPIPGRSHYEEGYIEGKAAGSLSIATEALKLDGMINALTQHGVNQRTAATMPEGGSLSIDLSAKLSSGFVGQDVQFAANKAVASVVGPDSAFPGLEKQNEKPAPAPLILGGDFQSASGISNLSIKTTGSAGIEKGLTVAVPKAGALNLTAGQLNVQGSIDAPGGQVSLTTEVTDAALDRVDGRIIVATGSRVDVGGTWVNDRTQPGYSTDYSQLAIIDGGAITLRSQGDIELSAGSELAADGGAWLKQSGAISNGNGGSITLESQADTTRASANLSLDGSVHAYALAKGGSLKLVTNEIIVGSADAKFINTDLTPLRLDSGFFSEGGFGRYELVSNYHGVTLGSDAHLRLQAENLELTEGFTTAQSSRSIQGITRHTSLPVFLRNPVDLALALHPPLGQLKTNSGVTLQAGSSIQTDPKGQVSIVSEGNIDVAGSISAPAGGINLNIQAPSDAENGTSFMASQGIFLRDTARLDAQGTTLLTPNQYGLKTGELLAGGTVSLRAERGYILTAQSSSINVSGSSDQLNLPSTLHRGVMENPSTTPDEVTSLPVIRIAPAAQSMQLTTVASNGGNISLTAAEGILLDGTLQGRAGGSSATGGNLWVELDKSLRQEPSLAPFPAGDRIIEIKTQDGLNSPAGWSPGKDIPLALNGLAQIPAETIANSGFGSLTVKSNDQIRFQGSPSLDLENSIILDAPVLAWNGEAGQAHIGANYVAVGSSLNRHALSPANEGAGKLDITGRLVELFGGVSLQGYSDSRIASSGDLRLRGVAPNVTDEVSYSGEWKATGNLSLQAQQIYPTTASSYVVNLTGQNSTLSIERSPGTPSTVLSAGGDLSLNAANLVQAGDLLAPFGALHLHATQSITLAPGSLTSVSGEGLLVPFGRTPGGLDWLYPLVGINSLGNVVSGDINRVYKGAPEKVIDLSAPNIALESGATINMAGGGDLSAFEFVPGLGGSIDVLNPSDPNVVNGKYPLVESYAILPTLKSSFAPYDPIEFASYVGTPAGLKIGDSVYLAGGGGLAAGEYALLPAHYALLPGAYLVTPQTDSAGTLLPGQQAIVSAGGTAVAGYRKLVGTTENPASWAAFTVVPGTMATTRSEYQMQVASTFFDQQAAKEGTLANSSVNDAGRLTLAVTENLQLSANIVATAAAGGLGGQLDVVAPNLSVVSQRSQVPSSGTVQLVADDLNQLHIASLLLGGSRSSSAAGTHLNVSAEKVAVESGASLIGPEILLAAKDQVSVASGAEINGAGKQSVHSENYLLDGDGSLLRVSSSPQVGFKHANQTGTGGDLTIQAGANLRAEGSILIDSSRNTLIDGNLAIAGGDLAIYAGLINLGQAPAGTGGAILSETLLSGLRVNNLALTGRDGINFYGNLDLRLGSLVLDSPSLLGIDNPNIQISADSIRLTNSGATLSAPTTGAGQLSLHANALDFGPGTYAIAGFDSLNLQGTASTRFTGDGKLLSSAATHLATAQISGTNGANFTLDATGYSLDFSHTDGQPNHSIGLGTKFQALADSIAIGTRFDLPSGLASFTALQGDLNLLPTARINLAGVNLDFGSTHYSTSGGVLNLSANTGNIELQAGSSISLGGGNESSAGSLAIVASNGNALLNGSLDAFGGGGHLSVDARGFGAGGFSALNTLALTGGFDGSLGVRQRSGDLLIATGDTVRANQIMLSADGGGIQVNGTLDASGFDPGQIILSAEGQVILAPGASILATASGGKGGRVELSSNQAVASADNEQGLVLQALSTIDVSGTEGGGDILLRALRNEQTVAIAPIASHIKGANSLIAEAVKVEDAAALDQIDTWKSDTSSFMANSADLSQALGGGVKVLPGLEIRATGDLSLDQTWNLFDWRYSVNGESLPGFLTIRAGGNLSLNQSLTDGFNARTDINGSLLQSGSSWGLRLVSGADFGGNAQTPAWSADWRQSQAGVGDLTIGSGALVRTGTGDIDIRAGGNVTLTDQTSVIYTAGHKDVDASTRYGNLTPVFVRAYFRGNDFPTGGGDIRISAGGNINGAASTQFVPDWQRRMGSFQNVSAAERQIGNVFLDGTVSEEELPTAWGINFNFQQNIGALGGGDVTVTAGQDINNLQVMLPTTGKPVGQVNTAVDVSSATKLNRYITNEVQINGGGNLTVSALGNINGGQYYVDRGVANISSRGSIQGGNPQAIQFSAGPLFAIGNADFHVTAAHDLQVGAAYNPFALAQQQASLIFLTPSTYFGYTDNSALRLKSLAGDITFRNDIDLLANQYLDPDGVTVIGDRSAQEAIKILPGTLDAIALQGGINLSSFNIFPTATGNLSLIAEHDIQSDPVPAEVVVNMTDADPALFPSLTYPVRDMAGIMALLDTREPDPVRLPKTPLHANDSSYAQIMSRLGNINGNSNLKIYLPKPAIISAGQDILDIGLNLQNMNPTQVSLIQTGRDLRYHINRGSAGDLLELQGFGVQVQGPGQLHVLAGRNIDLGASDGITTTGNLVNTNMDDVGASLSLLAGLSSKPTYSSLLEAYFGNNGTYRLDEAGKVVFGANAEAGTLARIQALGDDQQRELALLVLFNELKLSSQEAAKGQGYQRGERAIATLFPGDDYSGDIKLFFSRVHTLDGGNIELLAPGGLINAGLASAFVGEKKPSELGVVTQRGGAVLSYTKGDFQVNQSRVFAIASLPTDFTPRFGLFDTTGSNIEPYKDIIAWSADGSIDAGRGSKGALSVSGGKKGFDQLGNLTEDVPPTIDGSGIRAQIRGTIDPGNVYLVAPKGIVDAGEAGIGGSQVTIAATAIVGATNIQTGSGGLSSNVATTTAPAVVAPAAASSAAASASQMAQQSTAESASKNKTDSSENPASNTKVSILSAELVGAGEYSVNDIREGKHQTAAGAPSADKERAIDESENDKKKGNINQ